MQQSQLTSRRVVAGLGWAGLGWAVAHRDIPQSERIDAVNAGNIKTKLRRIAASLVMGIDSTNSAKIVLRRERIPLVKRKLVAALDYSQMP